MPRLRFPRSTRSIQKRFWETSPWFLRDALDDLRRQWLNCIKQTNFELREFPNETIPLIAQDAMKAAVRLRKGDMDVAAASDLMKEIKNMIGVAQGRITIFAEAGKAVQEAATVFELYEDYVDAIRDLRKELKGIDGRLGGPKDIRGVLQAAVDQWAKTWMGVLGECRKGLGSRTAQNAVARFSQGKHVRRSRRTKTQEIQKSVDEGDEGNSERGQRRCWKRPRRHTVIRRGTRCDRCWRNWRRERLDTAETNASWNRLSPTCNA